MKAKIIFVSLLMTLCAKGFAQDIIHTINEGTIEAKVTEISDDVVRYKTFDNLDGPDYVMPVGRISRIVFENGTQRVFTLNDYFGPLQYRFGSFYDSRGRLYNSQVREYLGDQLYNGQYRKARNQFQLGTGLTVGGATLLLASVAGGTIITIINNMNTDNIEQKSLLPFYVGGAAGAVCLGIGIPLMISGNRKLTAVADEYNLEYNNAQACTPVLQIGATGNGFGLALRF